MTSNDEMFHGALAPYGVPNVPFDIALDYRIDLAAEVLDLKTLEVDKCGRPKNVVMVVDGISDKSSMAGAKDDGKLRRPTLIINKMAPDFWPSC